MDWSTIFSDLAQAVAAIGAFVGAISGIIAAVKASKTHAIVSGANNGQTSQSGP